MNVPCMAMVYFNTQFIEYVARADKMTTFCLSVLEQSNMQKMFSIHTATVLSRFFRCRDRVCESTVLVSCRVSGV